ncbi:MAG: helix-turn-helix domain-containing protein [Geminicoccaceae bacterium]
MRILDAVANEFGVSVSDLRGKRRSRDKAWPRQVVMYLGHKLAGHSSLKVGRQLGRRDHATVLYGAQKAAERAMADPGYAERLQRAWAVAVDEDNGSFVGGSTS